MADYIWLDGKYMSATEAQAYVNNLKAQITKWAELATKEVKSNETRDD